MSRTLITWRNVGAPNFSDSNRLATDSVGMLDRGLQKLAGAATDYRQGQLDTEESMRDINTQNFMRQVQGFNDLDGYDSFQQRMQQELGQFNPAQVDFNQVNAALEGRDNTLRTDFLQGQEFSDKKQQIAAQPDVFDINQLIQQGRFDEATTRINESGNIRDKGKYLSQVNAASDAQREEDFTLGERNRTMDLRKQNQTALDIRNTALQNIDDPTNLEDTVQDQLNSAGITDASVVRDTLKGLQADYNARNGLTVDQQGEVNKLKQRYATVLDNAQRDVETMAGSEPTYGDELGHFLDTDNTVANAMKYVSEQSDKDVSWYEIGDNLSSLWGGDSRWGGDASKMAEKALDNAVTSLQKSEGMQSLLKGDDGERIKGAAVKYAMDYVSNSNSSGWNQDDFEAAIKKGIELFDSRNTAILNHKNEYNDLVKTLKTLQTGASSSVDSLEKRLKKERREGK